MTIKSNQFDHSTFDDSKLEIKDIKSILDYFTLTHNPMYSEED